MGNKKGNEFGVFAEQLAAEHLMAQGYVVRERNWRPPYSHLEVDLITQKDDTIIFVEVKARAAGSQDPADAVDLKKQRRLSRAGEMYLRGLNEDYFYRFDIITVSGNMEEYTLDHIEDAFLPPLGSY